MLLRPAFFSRNLVQRRVNEEYLSVNQCIPYYCNTTCHPMTFPLTFEFDNRNKIITDNYQFIKWGWTVLNCNNFIFPYIYIQCFVIIVGHREIQGLNQVRSESEFWLFWMEGVIIRCLPVCFPFFEMVNKRIHRLHSVPDPSYSIMRSLLLVFVFQLAQSGTLRGDYEPHDQKCDTRLIETPPTRSI